MRLTTRTRYAIRAMVELAQQLPGCVIRLTDIARHQRVTIKYLEQIFIKLHNAGLVESKKGPGGGYMLTRDPDTITLFDIMQAVGESTAPVQCTLNVHDRYCSGIEICPIKPHWSKLKSIVDAFLKETSLHDIASDDAFHQSE